MWSLQLKSQFKQLQILAWKKKIQLYQLSYEDPYVGNRPVSIEFMFTRDRNEMWNEVNMNCGNITISAFASYKLALDTRIHSKTEMLYIVI